MDRFKALVVDKHDSGVNLGFQDWSADQLLDGDVTIRVAYSSVNYKDALATLPDGRVARRYPLIPGIDLSGTVVESRSPDFSPGQPVVAHGYELGVSHHGGYAELARVPAGWVVPLPNGMTLRQAMVIGTAGFTAALSVAQLERMGLTPAAGTVVVTGASGGVGSIAVAILAARGYTVAASTGSPEAHDFLRRLGAAEIVDRAETSTPSDRPLDRARWAGAVDAVGGPTLANLIATTQTGGSIAISGNVGGAAVNTTVLPFILRGVNVLGIDSANYPIADRIRLWNRLADDLRPPRLEETIAHEVSLEQVPDVLGEIHRGAVRGRAVVRVGGA